MKKAQKLLSFLWSKLFISLLLLQNLSEGKLIYILCFEFSLGWENAHCPNAFLTNESGKERLLLTQKRQVFCSLADAILDQGSTCCAQDENSHGCLSVEPKMAHNPHPRSTCSSSSKGKIWLPEKTSLGKCFKNKKKNPLLKTTLKVSRDWVQLSSAQIGIEQRGE